MTTLDITIVVACWLLIPGVLIAKVVMDAKRARVWRKDLGER